jgi:hypothetical protein
MKAVAQIKANWRERLTDDFSPSARAGHAGRECKLHTIRTGNLLISTYFDCAQGDLCADVIIRMIQRKWSDVYGSLGQKGYLSWEMNAVYGF